jgi:hypothetical protein
VKPSKLILYIVVLAALAGYVYFVEVKGQEKEEAQKAKDEKLVSLEKQKIDQVILKSRDGKDISLRKTAGVWVLTEPVKAKADEESIRDLLTTLDKASLEKLISEDNGDWSEYGLDKPAFTVIIKAGEEETALMFGESNPSETSYYLRVKDEKRLTLVEDTLRNALKKPALHYRDKTVISLAPEDIDEFRIKTDKGETVFKKGDKGVWNVTGEESYRARKDQVDRILRDLTNMEAEEIIDDPENGNLDFGFKKPEKTIIFKGGKPDQVVHIGDLAMSEDKESPFKLRYVKVKGRNPVFVTPSRNFNSLKVTRKELEDKTLLSLKANDISDIEIEIKDRTWNIVRDKKDKWRLESPEDRELDTWPVNNLIWAFTDLKWTEIASENPSDLSEYHLDNPDIIAEFKLKGVKDTVSFKAGWKDAEASAKKSDKGDEREDPTNTQTTDGVAEKDSKEEPAEGASPKKAFAIVKPHYMGEAVFAIDPGFMERLKTNLDSLTEGEAKDQ